MGRNGYLTPCGVALCTTVQSVLPHYCPALNLRPDLIKSMVTLTNTNLLYNTWETLHTFRKTGRYWIQFQRFYIRGIEGIVVADAFDTPNRVTQRLTRQQIEEKITNGRALFIVVCSEGCKQRKKESLVTDWITDGDSLQTLEERLAAFFDLYCCLAVESQYSYHGKGVIPIPLPEPVLRSSTVLPGCQKQMWQEQIVSEYPNVYLLQCRFAHRQGLMFLLKRFQDKFAQRGRTRDWELDFDQFDAGVRVQTHEHPAIIRFFREELEKFEIFHRFVRWGGSQDFSISLYKELRTALTAIGCGEYIERLFKPVIQDFLVTELHTRRAGQRNTKQIMGSLHSREQSMLINGRREAVLVR